MTNFKMRQKEKLKYDAAYISYVEKGESAAVFITRDIVNSIDTNGKWVDVLSIQGNKNYDNQWDFSEIIVEIFPRKKSPVYPDHTSDANKKYITWKTAHNDITAQRKSGRKGIKFRITPKLINKNKGKYKTIERVWNNKFNRYVPREWGIGSSCEIRKCRIPIEPKWEYHILAVKRI